MTTSLMATIALGERMDAPGEAGIFAREAPTLDRTVQCGVAGSRLLSVSFPAAPDASASGSHQILDRICEYLEGATDSFDDVTVGLTVPTDQRAVLEATRKIPYGETASCEQLRSMAGLDEDETATVHTALRSNPIPIVVPDHRVSDGPSAVPSAVERRLRSLEGL